MEENQQLTTPAVDLLAPSSRFASSSGLYGRLHRWHLLLRRYWWAVGLILALVLAPAYFYSADLPPAYQSKARMWLAGRLNISEGRIYTEELVDYLSTQSELLRSSAVQQRALARLRNQFTNEYAAAIASQNRAGLKPVRKAKALIRRMAGLDASSSATAEDASPFRLKITEASKSSILELRATGPDPAATRAFLDCLMDGYFVFKKENREKVSERTLESVSGEVHQLAEELRQQQERLHAFQSSNNVVFLQEQGNSAGSYLAQLNRQIAGLRTQLQLLERLDPEQWADSESRRGQMTTGEPAEAAAREVLANLAGPQADLFRASQQRQLLKAKRDELSRFLRPLHPKIVKLDEEIATQEKLVQISRDESLRQLTNRRQALQLEIKNLESAFKEWDVKAIDSSRKMADYDRMRQDLQRLQTAYDRLFSVMQTVDVSKTVEQENLAVLEPASAARHLPRLAINLLLAFAAALALSAICLYCLGMFDDRFASLLELADCLSEEILGQVPAISLKKPSGPLEVRFLERQRFEFLESFRNIRSSLWFMRNGATRPKAILITSSVPKEGKSTVTLYLAATMALANSRVLLIDADMRRGSMHKFFAAPLGPGLAEILSHEVSPTRAILPSSMENLWLLPAGTARRNPGELVLSPEWSQFLAEVYPRFDYILVDSPPLLATDDAACLAPKVDGVVMVVRGSYTSARMARRAISVLRQRQAHVLGLVFNRALLSAYEYHSYRHYRDQYGWRPNTPPAAEIAFGSARQDHGARVP